MGHLADIGVHTISCPQFQHFHLVIVITIEGPHINSAQEPPEQFTVAVLTQKPWVVFDISRCV